jgi:hypothetical protein
MAASIAAGIVAMVYQRGVSAGPFTTARLWADAEQFPSNKETLLSPAGDDLEEFDALSGSCIPMCHLHGHVGWLRHENEKTFVAGSRDASGTHRSPAIAYMAPERAVIGIPGSDKADLPSGLLQPLWDRAQKAIESADSIVFVGYRFPETDNLAKHWILDAMRAKRSGPATVHTVLRAHNPDTLRLKGMIEWTRNPSTHPVRVHEMGVEDFFAAFDRDGLFS